MAAPMNPPPSSTPAPALVAARGRAASDLHPTGVVAIPLRRGNGACAIVDAADVPLVSGYSWRRDRAGYAVATYHRGGRHVSLHRLLLGLVDAPREVFVDHANGDRLRNTRDNLRVTDNSGNQANRQVVRSATGFKGATLHRCGRYQAACKKSGRNHHAGLHATALDAAVAYWQKARELHGEMAWTTDEVRAEAERRATLRAEDTPHHHDEARAA